MTKAPIRIELRLLALGSWVMSLYHHSLVCERRGELPARLAAIAHLRSFLDGRLITWESTGYAADAIASV